MLWTDEATIAQLARAIVRKTQFGYSVAAAEAHMRDTCNDAKAAGLPVSAHWPNSLDTASEIVAESYPMTLHKYPLCCNSECRLPLRNEWALDRRPDRDCIKCGTIQPINSDSCICYHSLEEYVQYIHGRASLARYFSVCMFGT